MKNYIGWNKSSEKTYDIKLNDFLDERISKWKKDNYKIYNKEFLDFNILIMEKIKDIEKFGYSKINNIIINRNNDYIEITYCINLLNNYYKDFEIGDNIYCMEFENHLMEFLEEIFTIEEKTIYSSIYNLNK